MFRLLPASAIAAALAALPVAANAATYSAVSSFSTAGPIAPFSYGYRIGTGPFIPYDAQTAACAAIAGLDCFYPSTYNNNNLPAVGQNVTGSLISSGSVHIPTDVLFMHPVGLNSQLAAGDTIVRFTAPAAGFYEISGNFQILDDSASGVNVSVEGVGSSFAQSLNGPLNTTAGFSFSDSLLAGQTLDFVVDSAGSYFDDSTGLRATLSVPEPVSMVMLGVGLLGLGVTRRRT